MTDFRFCALAMIVPLALGGCSLFRHADHQASLPAVRVAGGDVQDVTLRAQAALASGRRYLDEGRPGLAIEAFRMALDGGGSPAPALNGMGVAYARLGELETAGRLFEEAVAMAPDRADYIANLARAEVPSHSAGPALAMRPPEPAAPVAAVAHSGLERISSHEVRVTTRVPVGAVSRIVIGYGQAGAARKDAPVDAGPAAPSSGAVRFVVNPHVAVGTDVPSPRPQL